SLSYICKNNGKIYNCVKRKKWPGIAAVTISVVSFLKGTRAIDCFLNNNPVEFISPFLLAMKIIDEPNPLKVNEGKACKGPNIYGEGFIFQDSSEKSEPVETYKNILATDKSVSRIVFP